MILWYIRERIYFITIPKGMPPLERLSKDDVPLGLVIKYIRSRMYHEIMFG